MARRIQRVWRGRLGRRRFHRKMAVVRTAAVTIQVRIRGILARQRAAEVRQTALTAELERTTKEEAACARALEETRDFLHTKAGKREYKERRAEVRGEKRRVAVAENRALLGNRKYSLRQLRDAFRLADHRGTGLLTRAQFEEMLSKTLLLVMSDDDFDNAWRKTATVKATRGGYRLSDIPDQRELPELVAWYESGEDRKVGVRAAAGRAGLKAARTFSCKAGSTTRLAQQQVFLRARRERLEVFRQDRPPPFECEHCKRRFVFSYELERHVDQGARKAKPCGNLYYCPVLDD
jgi:hypothetical protein